MTLTVMIFRSEGTMVHDRIAEELEAKRLYRRAAARWGEVMMLVEHRQGTRTGGNATAGCSLKAQRPPEPPTENLGALKMSVIALKTNGDSWYWQKQYGATTRRSEHTAGAIRLLRLKKPDKVTGAYRAFVYEVFWCTAHMIG